MTISKEEKLAQLSEAKKEVEKQFNAAQAAQVQLKERYAVLTGEENAVKATLDGTEFEEVTD
tara:strand:+ start:470 stop:655 length:186 start_codon:yes stop_codon:yes gene_type:complete